MKSRWQRFSKLQFKVLAAISGTFWVLFLGHLGIARSIIMRGYTELELKQAGTNGERLERAFLRHMDDLNAVTRDWSIWDDTYEFVQTGDSSYIDSNLTFDSFLALSLNMIAIFDNDRNLVYGCVVNLETEEMMAIPKSLLTDLVQHPVLLNQPIDNAESVGFVELGQRPMLIASHVILTSNRQGPSHGHILMAKFFGPSQLADLTETVRLPVESFSYNVDDLPEDVRTIAPTLNTYPDNVGVQVLKNNQIASYALLSDVTGTPALILRTIGDRDIYAKGQISFQYYVWSSLLTAAGFGLVILLLIRYLVLSRLETLSQQVNHIGSDKPDLVEISIPGQDELAQLANTINWALRQLHQRTTELQAAKQLADEANRAKSIFLTNISHELRTPLNAILGFAQILSRNDAIHSQQREQIGIINRSGEHLLSLINDVLDMSSIEAGHIHLNISPFDLHFLLATLEDMLHLKANSKGIDLLIECADSVPRHLCCDSRRLRQILINLINNAIKFTTTGYVKLTVTRLDDCQAQPITNKTVHLQFSVQDTGIGIAAEELPLLFEPFGQTEAGQQANQGTGLGLPISQKFVELMGGELTVRSQLGQGTDFTFDIWAEIAGSTDIAVRLPQRGIIGLEADQSTYRILIVDDRAMNRKLLMDMLSPIGFELREAENGRRALEQWKTWHPHLIWMDIQMPIMDGYEATRQIRSMERAGAKVNGVGWEGVGESRNERGRDFKLLTKNNSNDLRSSVSGYQTSYCSKSLSFSSLTRASTATKIIALTASNLEEERAIALLAGCDDLVRKPLQQTTIFNKMAEYLGICYRYGDVADEALRRNPSPAGPVLGERADPSSLQAALATLSPDWIKQLRQAAMQLRSQEALVLIAQIPPEHRELQQIIEAKVNNFDFDQVISLVDTAFNPDTSKNTEM